MKRAWGSTVIMLAAMVMAAGAASAADEAPRLGYLEGSMRKLGRGAANIMTAPLELIRTPSLVNERDGWIAGLTVGFTQGISNVAIRELGGILEIGTFLLPMPKNFQPLVKPEFVFQNGRWVS